MVRLYLFSQLVQLQTAQMLRLHDFIPIPLAVPLEEGDRIFELSSLFAEFVCQRLQLSVSVLERLPQSGVFELGLLEGVEVHPLQCLHFLKVVILEFAL